ncbi:hypothetical protein PFICI_12331 [Pestalotiopsis fici W106-1]|uniref:Cytochrome b5 heme-binding domain-containing protein n=1 Tax=Pestalotiopsis fici (strain W106-1 / CGMCC3.15140) TaxID=1229662 RepID=W3WQG9_PESFW|nr:uncharacterized protein PFICI_12331 [Pestalotiopsis fici W106-1]ETS75387.1 hypothetical protein PFICI_12331 [Pestalotiopsis fici W106-1]
MTTTHQEITQVVVLKAEAAGEPIANTVVLTQVATDGDEITVATTTKSECPKTEDTVNYSDTVPSYSARQVAEHKSATDLWIIVDNDVYDVTRFQHEHPGGHKVMAGVAGKDATKKFDKYHRRGILEKYKKDFKIGILATEPLGQETRSGLFGILKARKK